jgi:hypothetical protein
VAYRHGYRVRGDDERTLDAIVAHLQESTSDNPLNLRASFEILRKEGNRDIVQMKLAYTPTEAPGDQAHERPVQVWAICSDDNGNRAAPIVRKSMAQRLGTAEGAFADSLQMGLPPGPYTWSVALKDVSTNVTSYFVVRKEL